MKYKTYTITIEVETDRAVYECDDNGEMGQFIQAIDTEPEPVFYGIQDSNGDWIEWLDYSKGLDAVKKFIDKRS